MFSVEDILFYPPSGVCRITDVRQETFTGEPKMYYILKPLCHGGSTVYVPQDNERLLSRMRALPTPEQASALLEAARTADLVWTDDAKTRQAEYEQTLAQGDRLGVLCLLRTLAVHKREMLSQRRKFYAVDERMLIAAKKAALEEFAYVLDCSEEQVLATLLS